MFSYYANNSQQLSVQVFVTRSICHGLSEILQGYLILVLYKSVLHQHYNLNLNFIFIAQV